MRIATFVAFRTLPYKIELAQLWPLLLARWMDRDRDLAVVSFIDALRSKSLTWTLGVRCFDPSVGNISSFSGLNVCICARKHSSL